MAKFLEKSALKKRAETLLNIKNSSFGTKLETFAENLYMAVKNTKSLKIFSQLEKFQYYLERDE